MLVPSRLFSLRVSITVSFVLVAVRFFRSPRLSLSGAFVTLESIGMRGEKATEGRPGGALERHSPLKGGSFGSRNAASVGRVVPICPPLNNREL